VFRICTGPAQFIIRNWFSCHLSEGTITDVQFSLNYDLPLLNHAVYLGSSLSAD